MVHPPLLVERRDGFGPCDLAARRPYRGKRHVRVDHPQCCLVHLTAVVDLGDDVVSAVRRGRQRHLRPSSAGSGRTDRRAPRPAVVVLPTTTMPVRRSRGDVAGLDRLHHHPEPPQAPPMCAPPRLDRGTTTRRGRRRGSSASSSCRPAACPAHRSTIPAPGRSEPDPAVLIGSSRGSRPPSRSASSARTSFCRPRRRGRPPRADRGRARSPNISMSQACGERQRPSSSHQWRHAAARAGVRVRRAVEAVAIAPVGPGQSPLRRP